MTETVVCARCHCTFERTCVDGKEVLEAHVTQVYVQETEAVCDECEHEFLAWVGCPPLC